MAAKLRLEGDGDSSSGVFGQSLTGIIRMAVMWYFAMKFFSPKKPSEPSVFIDSFFHKGEALIDHFSLLLKQPIEPLRVMPKDAAVQKFVDFMNAYSLSQEDFDTIVELSKFKPHMNPLDGIQPTVKATLTKAYKEVSKS